MIDQKVQTILKASELCEYKNSLLGNEIRDTTEVLAAMSAEGMTGNVMNTNGIEPDIIGIIENDAAYTPDDLEIREQVSANRSAALKKPTEDLKRWVSDRKAYYNKWYANAFWKYCCPPVYESGFNKASLYQEVQTRLNAANDRESIDSIRFNVASLSLYPRLNRLHTYEVTQNSPASYPWNIILSAGIICIASGAVYGKEAFNSLSTSFWGDVGGSLDFDAAAFKDWKLYVSTIGAMLLYYAIHYAQRYFAYKSFLSSASELGEQLDVESGAFQSAKSRVDQAEREEAKPQTNAAN